MRRVLVALTALCTVAAWGCSAPEPSGVDRPLIQQGDVVDTDAGPVRGTVAEDHRLFRGIPYAAPPVGPLRWRAPQPPTPWTAPRDATTSGEPCAQPPPPDGNGSGDDGTSDDETSDNETSDNETGDDQPGDNEDCLHLDVTAPDTDRPLPVMVWLHGGTGADGAGSRVDARRMALGGNVVVVTVDYRLGIFGTFGYPGLPDSGTFGLADQQAALRWVQRNIAHFGGDPGSVTLFGESYGALATTAQLTSPGAQGLFHRAVIQSGLTLHNYPPGAIVPGSPPLPSTWISAQELDAMGSAVAAEAGCPDPATALECLRRVPARELLPYTSIFVRYAFGNPMLPKDPVQALRDGAFHRVPVISGATRDEHRLYTALFYELAGEQITPQRYAQLLRDAFGAGADQVAARYPVQDDESPAVAWSAVLTDRIWALATREQNRLLAARVPTYAYEFADRDAPPVVEFPAGFPPGAYHSSELAYQFDAPDGPELGAASGEFTADQRELAGQLNAYWTNFARTGDPNGPGLPPWDRFTHGGPVQSLAPGVDGIRPVDYSAEHQLDFWYRLR